MYGTRRYCEKSSVRLLRENVVMDGELESLKRFKDDIKK